jgi:hypothetical protein
MLLLQLQVWIWRSQTDKRERAEKAARDKAIREGQAPPPSAAPAAKPTGLKSSENPETRLQVSGCGWAIAVADDSKVRLSVGGAPLTKTFASDSSQFTFIVLGDLNWWCQRLLMWPNGWLQRIWRESLGFQAMVKELTAQIRRIDREVLIDIPSVCCFCWWRRRTLNEPSKQFSQVDMKKSLKENGLTPSAVLMAGL